MVINIIIVIFIDIVMVVTNIANLINITTVVTNSVIFIMVINTTVTKVKCFKFTKLVLNNFMNLIIYFINEIDSMINVVTIF